MELHLTTNRSLQRNTGQSEPYLPHLPHDLVLNDSIQSCPFKILKHQLSSRQLFFFCWSISPASDNPPWELLIGGSVVWFGLFPFTDSLGGILRIYRGMCTVSSNSWTSFLWCIVASVVGANKISIVSQSRHTEGWFPLVTLKRKQSPHYVVLQTKLSVIIASRAGEKD